MQVEVAHKSKNLMKQQKWVSAKTAGSGSHVEFLISMKDFHHLLNSPVNFSSNKHIGFKRRFLNDFLFSQMYLCIFCTNYYFFFCTEKSREHFIELFVMFIQLIPSNIKNKVWNKKCIYSVLLTICIVTGNMLVG
jgi:hypothetical protein